MLMAVLPGLTYGAAAPAQGGSQTAQLYDAATNEVHADVTVLENVAIYTDEGGQYFLNRVNQVYDISAGNDAYIQIFYSAGMNAYSDELWKNNGMRYFSVVDVETGKVVANWKNDGTAVGERNSSGAYQVGYGTVPGFVANQKGVLYTIPRAALENNTVYYVVCGSATCGNNNSKMLYAPVIYEITTSDEDGTGTVKTENPVRPEQHNITVNLLKAEDDTESKVEFNRLQSLGGQAVYLAGDPITAAYPGWEIPLVVTAEGERTYEIIIEDSDGKLVPFNGFEGGGPSASSFGDHRFTMPNDDVTVDVIFEGYVDDDVVAVTGISLDKDTVELEPAETLTLIATITPMHATNIAVSWTSSDTEVATVDAYGVVTGISTGVTVITATTEDGGFTDTCTITVAEVEGGEKPVYTVTPLEDATYTIGETQDGIKTMTVNTGSAGLRYFPVNISPVIAHSGDETAVFVHLRDGIQLELNATRADFDLVQTASAGFNVLAGDLIKIYLVDDLSNAEDFNPTIYQ